MNLLLRAAALVARVWEAGASGATAIRGRAGLAAEGLGAVWRGEVGQSSIHRRDPPPLRVDDALGALAFGFAAQAAVQITAVEAAGLLRTVGILRQSLGRVNGNVLLNERPLGRIHAPRRRLRDSHQLRCKPPFGCSRHRRRRAMPLPEMVSALSPTSWRCVISRRGFFKKISSLTEVFPSSI